MVSELIPSYLAHICQPGNISVSYVWFGLWNVLDLNPEVRAHQYFSGEWKTWGK